MTISSTIEQFLQQCGLHGISMEEGGSLNLTIEATGKLQLLHRPPHFLIGINRKVENLYSLDARKILARAHYREKKIKPLHMRLHDNVLGIYYIFGEREIDSSLLSTALDSLTELIEQIFQTL